MAQKNTSTNLQISSRDTGSSRATRRLRREGRVPGVLYGRGIDPLSFAVDERELRHALAGSGAVLELSLDGQNTSAVLKDAQRHPVRGEIIHVDLLRVDLNKPISAIVTVEVINGDDSPGAKRGGIVEQITREVNIEALPNAIPETIVFDAIGLNLGDTVGLDALQIPDGVTLLDDPAEVVLLTVTLPTIDADAEGDEEIETETERVGDAESGDEAAAEGDSDAGGDDASE
ncbi:MAG: ribosomal rRNA E-loop binding protein Ctc/L25/TL5 [Solirubrobacterales bacterium]|nr:ribosomal rRNA E-loop binding protein Ctc/L25/TL5 [Solirubrobacterales bacterium]